MVANRVFLHTFSICFKPLTIVTSAFVYSLFKYAAEVTEVLYEQDFEFFHRELKLLLDPVQ